MVTSRLVARILSAGLMALSAGAACGQGYPAKLIRVITAEAGGSSDLVSRLISQELSAGLGQQVIVENRGGASGVIAAETFVKARPDGYTLLLYSTGIWILPLMQKVPYDPVRDFSPITLATMAPNILVVHPSLPVKSVKELIALAKARPGELNYGSGGSGTSNHLAAELFNAMAGVKIVRIFYKSGGLALKDLAGGHVHLMFSVASYTAPHVKSGRVRALAVTSARPSALLPGLPTVAAAGLPGYESVGMTGLFALAKTPAAIITRLN